MFKKISFIFTSIIFLSIRASAFETVAEYAVLIDATTNEVLFEKNAHEKMAPSSMSKMMTVYVVLDALKKGEIKLDDIVTHSESAWKQEGSRMFIPLGEQITVDELLKGVIIQSGNDAAVSLAELLGGTEQEFANRLNSHAKKLNLLNSSFVNATGLPNENHYTTAYDLAKIAQYTIENFPEHYSLYSQKDYTYNGIKQANRNMLLSTYEGVDGLKTGHTDKAGYGLTSSVNKEGRRLIAVVNGLPTNKIAAQESEKLLKYGYAHFKMNEVAKKDQVIGEAIVKNGEQNKLEIIASQDIVVNTERAKDIKVTYKLNINNPLIAPIAQYAEVGKIEVIDEDQKVLKEFKAIAKYEIKKAGIFRSLGQHFMNLFN
jgi:D-alanyl-D-alanine carboxypeptidase (penicillin-binding protein 5/6)